MKTRTKLATAVTIGLLSLGGATVAVADPGVPGTRCVWTGGGWACGPGPAPEVPVERIGGADRYETAVNVSRANFAPGVATVHVVSGTAYADALAAAAVADGPLLLVPSTGTLPASVVTELKRLNPVKVVVVGGEGSVSKSVEDQVAAAAAG